MRRIHIDNNDNFNARNAIMLLIILIAAILLAGAKYAKENNDPPILEATKSTSQVVNTGVGFI